MIKIAEVGELSCWQPFHILLDQSQLSEANTFWGSFTGKKKSQQLER